MHLAKIFLVTIALALLSLEGKAQDTLSIYFDVSSSKITSSHIEKMEKFYQTHDLNSVIKVDLVGMADSSGNITSNQKLSEKRARETWKISKDYFPADIEYRVYAVGEVGSSELKKNRRVDIVLIYRDENTPEEETDKGFEEKKEQCYYVDYHLLHRSNIREIVKRKKEYILITARGITVEKNEPHYYGMLDKEGNFVIKKVKWSRSNGSAKIPKSSFEDFSIFSLGDPPCEECNEDFGQNQKIELADTCIQVDRFLMQSLQFKRILFNSKEFKIRTSKEYVNIDDHYFVGCDLEYELTWTTKRAKRKRDYYFSRLPIIYNRLANIIRVMDCCKKDEEPSECDFGFIKCQVFLPPDKRLHIYGETGVLNDNSNTTFYGGIGLAKAGDYGRSSLIAGITDNGGLFTSFQYQMHFLSFDFRILSPVSSWHYANYSPYASKYGRLYVGGNLTGLTSDNSSFDVITGGHLGIAAVDEDDKALISRIFVQYGFASNLTGDAGKFEALLQAGIGLKIYGFKNTSLVSP